MDVELDPIPTHDDEYSDWGVEWDDDAEVLPGLTVSEVVDQLKKSQEWIELTDPVSDGTIGWRPHLWSQDRKRVLHVHLVGEIRCYLRQRLRMATGAGMQVVVAMQLGGLYQYEVVEFLSDIGADVIMVDVDDEITLSQEDNLLTVLSDRAVPVRLETRTRIARRSWDDRTLGSSFEKGRRFEGLMAFLLGQVGDFRVIERNFRGDTDEIDIVLQVDNWSARCWQFPGSPFVLVEAKNWTNPVDQAAVTVFNGKLKTKRQTTRLGLMFAASRFTTDAKLQIVKFAQDKEIIALIDCDRIVEWIDSVEPEEYLEQTVRRAMLR